MFVVMYGDSYDRDVIGLTLTLAQANDLARKHAATCEYATKYDYYNAREFIPNQLSDDETEIDLGFALELVEGV
jgi:hypothetical protein